ncbi:MAG: hypothetical protein FWE80_09450 [Oscillospiraceae bacterium]|nr:hypothetical protein [Oscillospiraceae bacterium]
MNQETIIREAYGSMALPETDLHGAVRARLAGPEKKNRAQARLRPVAICAALAILLTVAAAAATTTALIQSGANNIKTYIKIEEDTIPAAAAPVFIQNGKTYMETGPDGGINLAAPGECLPLTEELLNFRNNSKPNSPVHEDEGSSYLLEFSSFAAAGQFFNVKITENPLLKPYDVHARLSFSPLFAGIAAYAHMHYEFGDYEDEGWCGYGDIFITCTSESVKEQVIENFGDVKSGGISVPDGWTAQTYISPANGIQAQFAIGGTHDAPDAVILINKNGLTHTMRVINKGEDFIKRFIDAFE